MADSEVVYTPAALGDRGLAAWRADLRGLLAHRELIGRLFHRGVAVRFRQSLLGYFWALVPTLLTVITFTFLKQRQVVPISDTDMPYPLFVLIGMCVWQLFAGGLILMTQSLVRAGGLVSKVGFPRETVVLAAFLESLIDTVIRIGLILVFFGLFRFVPSWQAILVPLVLVPLAMMTLGVGFVFAAVNAVFRDLGQALTPVLTFGMFLAPVVYPASDAWPASLVKYLNPVSPFILATRDLIEGRPLGEPVALAGATAVAIIVLLLGWRTFAVAMPRLVERV